MTEKFWIKSTGQTTCTQFSGHWIKIEKLRIHHGCFSEFRGEASILFLLGSCCYCNSNILGNRLGEGLKGGMILFKSMIPIWISPARCPRRMQSSISSRKTPKDKKRSRKRKTAQNLSILSCFVMECRWWDSNPHGFPSDFESLASAIPPHRLMGIGNEQKHYTRFPGQNQERI